MSAVTTEPTHGTVVAWAIEAGNRSGDGDTRGGFGVDRSIARAGVASGGRWTVRSRFDWQAETSTNSTKTRITGSFRFARVSGMFAMSIPHSRRDRSVVYRSAERLSTSDARSRREEQHGSSFPRAERCRRSITSSVSPSATAVTPATSTDVGTERERLTPTNARTGQLHGQANVRIVKRAIFRTVPIAHPPTRRSRNRVGPRIHPQSWRRGRGDLPAVLPLRWTLRNRPPERTAASDADEPEAVEPRVHL